MNLPKFIRYPFAATGDKTSVPDDVEPSGNISYAEGYGFDYERNPAGLKKKTMFRWLIIIPRHPPIARNGL